MFYAEVARNVPDCPKLCTVVAAATVEPKDAKEGSMKLMGLLRLSDNGCVEKYRRTLFQHTLFFDHQVLYVQCCHLSL